MKRIKPLFAFSLMLAMLKTVTAFAANSGIIVEVDKKQVTFSDQQPIIKDSRTLIPIRGVFEQLGYNIDWNVTTKTATLSNNINTVVITQDESTFKANNATFNLEVPAQIINDRIMLPFRAILESIGYSVAWDEEKNTIIVTSKPRTENVIENTTEEATEEITEKISETYEEYPKIPDIGIYASPNIKFNKKTNETDGITYWYKNISDATTSLYVSELIKLGYIKDTISSKPQYYVYTKDDLNIIIDTASYKNESYTLIAIKKIDNTLEKYYKQFPSIPSINAKYHSFITTTDGLGYTYRYLSLGSSVIKEYTKTLENLGFSVTNNSTYYTCRKDNITITINSDSVTIKSTTKKDETTKYYKEFKTVPQFEGDIIKTEKLSGSLRYRYYYEFFESSEIEKYAKDLQKLGFNIEEKESSGYFCILRKNDIKVTILTNCIDVERISKDSEEYFKDFPLIPDFIYALKNYYKLEGSQYVPDDFIFVVMIDPTNPNKENPIFVTDRQNGLMLYRFYYHKSNESPTNTSVLDIYEDRLIEDDFIKTDSTDKYRVFEKDNIKIKIERFETMVYGERKYLYVISTNQSY